MALPWFAAAWLIGVAGASELRFLSWQWIILGAAAATAAYGVRQDRLAGRVFLSLAFLFLGAARAQIAEESRVAATVARYIGQAASVDLNGIVSTTAVTWGEGDHFDLRSRWISPGGGSTAEAVSGIVLVIADPGESVRRGETIVARGRLRLPVGQERTGHSAVLETVSIQSLAAPLRSSPTSILDAARQRMIERLDSVLPAGEASLVAGVLLGADEGMPQEVRSAFRATGTTHILAVSGFNVTIVAAASLAAFGALLGARRGAVAAGAAILVYTLLTGAEAPVVRAAIMTGIVLLAARLGRQSAALASLAAAAILMTFWDPGAVEDVGFQLSFLATLGLVVAGRPLQEALRRWADGAIRNDGVRSVVIPLGEVVLITFVAQTATLPLSAYVFHQLPMTSLLANALILPAQPPLMATGAVAALGALADVSLGSAMAWLAWPFAAYTIRVAELFARLPGATLQLPAFGSGHLILVYAALAGISFAARVPKLRSAARTGVRLGGPVWLMAMAALTTLAWKAALDRPDGRLHLTALPGGDVLIETPGGRFVAMSRARGQVGLRAELDQHLPRTQPVLDWLILAHPEASPEAALVDMGKYAPQNTLLLQGAGSITEGWQMDSLSVTEIVKATAGTTLDLGDGARLEVTDPAEGRLTVVISAGSATVALVDYDDSGRLTSLARRGPGPVAVVLLGEARRVARALDADWGAWKPAVIIACPIPGEPFPEAQQAERVANVLATPLDGWVELTTDGEDLTIRVER